MRSDLPSDGLSPQHEHPEPRPRRRRPAERPAQILSAADRVLNRRGYDRATTREVAAEACVSEGTLYNYFGSKRAILLALIDSVGQELAARHRAYTGHQPLRTL